MDLGERIEHYLLTGEVPAGHRLPPAMRPVVDRRLREVLVAVVRHRAARAPRRRVRSPLDAAAVAERLRPMLTGLLPPPAADLALQRLPGRVVIPCILGFPALLEGLSLPEAWALANLLLDDLGAPPLADDTPVVDGLCAGGRAFIAGRALIDDGEPDRGRDVIVHEVAHLLHSVSASALELPGVRGAVLPVPAARHETFAWAAERLSCRLRSGRWPALSAAVHDRRADLGALHALSLAAEVEPSSAWSVLRTFALVGALPGAPSC